MKTSLKFCAWISLPVVLIMPAVAQIQQPQLGSMLDSEGMLRPVLGIAASASLGNPVLPNIESFACSSALCLAKADGGLVSFTPGAPAIPTATPCACPGAALLSLDGNGGAWVYFEATGQLMQWRNGTLSPVDFSPGGQVIALRATSDGLDYAIVREHFVTPGREFDREGTTRERNLVWLERYSANDGSVTVLDSLNSSGPVMLLDAAILTSSGDQVTLHRPNGQELSFPLTGANAFQSAGNGYVQISASGGMWLLHTEPGKEQLSLLPGTSQSVTKGLR